MTAPQRPLSVSQVVGLVKTFLPQNARTVFGTLLMGLDPLVSSFGQKPAKEQAYIAKRFEKLMQTPDLHQRLLAASVWQKVSKRYAPLPKIARWVRRSDLSVNSAMHVFHGFLAVAFDGAGYFSPMQRLKLDRHARGMYRHIVSLAAHRYSADLERLADMPPGAARHVALCTGQFIGRRHAPTAHILSMAETLTQMGYVVKIFNQSLTPSRSSSGFFFPYASPKFQDLNTVETLALSNGESAGFWQNPFDETCGKGFAGFVDAMAAFSPSHIISLGPANLFADLAGAYVPHASMPTTMDISIAQAGSYGCVRPLTPVQERLLAPLGIAPEQIVALPSGFARPKSNGIVPRERFQFAQDDYAIAIITNRANADISADFLARLENVLDRAPHVKLGIFGSTAAVTPLQLKRLQQHPQISFYGYAEDLYGVLAAFDAVLNPPRQGGGTSAAYAMDLGLNLFTLGDCDVANVAGEDFIYASIDEMLSAVLEASQDPDETASKQAQAKARWQVISDREGQMRRLLDGARKAKL